MAKKKKLSSEAEVDALFPETGYSVVTDPSDKDVVYDVLLNQADVEKNANKFYIIQLLQKGLPPFDRASLVSATWSDPSICFVQLMIY